MPSLTIEIDCKPVEAIVKTIVIPVFDAGRHTDDILKLTESVIVGVLCAVDALGGDEDNTAIDRIYSGAKQQMEARRKVTLSIRNEELQREKAERVKHANAVIRAIGSYGKKFFFSEKNGFSGFGVDEENVWFTDCHCREPFVPRVGQEWKAFTQGVTCREIVILLTDYIHFGKPVAREIFFRSRCRKDDTGQYVIGDPWGYGVEAMEKVRTEVFRSPAVEQEKESGAGNGDATGGPLSDIRRGSEGAMPQATSEDALIGRSREHADLEEETAA